MLTKEQVDVIVNQYINAHITFIDIQDKLGEHWKQQAIVIAPSWKGKDRPDIDRIDTGTWRITTHIRSDKDSHPKENIHLVPHTNVKVLWHLIKKVTDGYADFENVHEPVEGKKWRTSYKELTDALIEFYKEKGEDLTKGSEGKLRNLGKNYFDKYLFPLYILEKAKYVYYPKTIYRTHR